MNKKENTNTDNNRSKPTSSDSKKEFSHDREAYLKPITNTKELHIIKMCLHK